MTNEVAVAGTQVLQPVDMAVVSEYLDSTGLTKSLQPKEKTMFVQMCQGFGLNPFKREIYCTVYGSGQYRQCSIVTGFEVYLKRAERTGKLNGWHVESSGSVKNGDLTATVTIYRKDWSQPFTHTVYYSECVQTNREGKPNAVWAKQPAYMTKKVAMGQGFRLCFPDELGGMPYTNDEMGVDAAPVMERNITPPPQEAEPTKEVKQEEPKPAEGKPETKGELARKMLTDLLNKYGEPLKGRPKELILEVLKDGNAADDALVAMYDRSANYLMRKGIKVA